MKIRKDEQVSTLKGSMQNALGEAPVKAAAIAEELGLASSTLYNYCNEHIQEQQLPLRLFIPFCRATGSIEPVQFMARQLGVVVYRAPDVSSIHLKDIAHALLSAVTKVGEAITAYEGAGGENGEKITALEKSRLSLAVEKAVIAVLMVQKKVEGLKVE